MTVIAPADYYSARKLIRAAAIYNGPVYLRFTRDAIPFIYTEEDDFTIGKAKLLREGNDVSIIAQGDIMSLALSACEELAKQGVSARLLDMHTLKPLDEDAVRWAAQETGAIVTVEDHNILNGLGSAVCEVVAQLGQGKVRRMGVQDCFGESGPYHDLLAANGITVENIVRTVKELLR